MKVISSKKGESRRPAKTLSTGLRGEFVYRRLHAEIMEGKLKPGDRLREVELANRLEVSRTPVREALKRLQADGLITLSQARVLIVTSLSQRQVLELYAMREVLSGAAARFAAEQAAPMEIEQLKQIVSEQQHIDSPAKAAAQNRLLHEAIARAAHNEYLLRTMTVLADSMALLGVTTYAVRGRIESGRQENQAIVEHIAARNAADAEAAARQHIRNAGTLRLRLLFGEREPGLARSASRG
jgi:DNA-binding GntR family transcriptional regulator